MNKLISLPSFVLTLSRRRRPTPGSSVSALSAAHRAVVGVLAFTVSFGLARAAGAGPITIAQFSSPTVEDFTGLGLPFENAGPLVLAGVTYDPLLGVFTYANFGSDCATCAFGEAIGSNQDPGGGIVDGIDVTFSSPVFRAGGYMGFSYGTVSFFSPSNLLLGVVDLGISPPGPIDGAPALFAGWEDAGGISRIRFEDLSNDMSVAVIDRVMYESLTPIPEPASLTLFGLGLAGIGARLRRRKRASVDPRAEA